MSALPYMRLYVADYLADTSHLSTLEHGAYLLLIMNYWQRGESLPRGDAQLARIARVSAKEWSAIKPALAELFEDDGTCWRHGRIEQELAKVTTEKQHKANAGRASAASKAQQRANSRSTAVEQMPNDTDTDTETEEKGKLSLPQREQADAHGTPQRVSRGTRMAADFVPLPNVVNDAKNRGLTEPEIHDQLERMRDWALAATGQAGVKRDWNAFARNWLRRSADEKANRHAKPPSHHRPGNLAAILAD